MSDNAMVVRESGNLAPALSREQVDLIKSTIAKGATDSELKLFIQVCNRTQLDPFARQIYAIKRWSAQDQREVMQTQISIDGARLIAERSGKYAGQLGPFWTANGKDWVDCWLDKTPPRAAKVGILRSDFKEPIWAVATWDAYVQTKKDGSTTAMWQKMGPTMIAKCAESQGLRKAFPQELSGLYTSEEMDQAVANIKPADRVDGSTGEVINAQPPIEMRQKDTDKATPEQRQALTKNALSAHLGNQADADKWIGDSLRKLGCKKWGDLTVAMYQKLIADLIELTRVAPDPAPAADDDALASFEAAQDAQNYADSQEH